jgi:hypothetical protein
VTSKAAIVPGVVTMAVGVALPSLKLPLSGAYYLALAVGFALIVLGAVAWAGSTRRSCIAAAALTGATAYASGWLAASNTQIFGWLLVAAIAAFVVTIGLVLAAIFRPRRRDLKAISRHLPGD